MDFGLRGRTAAVAAGSAGLGLGSAIALASEGVRVAICGRDADRLRAAAERIGNDCLTIRADVSTQAGGQHFVEEAIAALGHVDILVTNAGGPPVGGFDNTPPERYLPALELNLLSVVGMCHAAVPAMRERRWGRVVAITSYTVRQPLPHLILSNTARAGVTGFLKTVARQVAADGVTVNSVQPGLHATDRMQAFGDSLPHMIAQVPAGTMGDAGDFGAVVAFLCSEQAKFVTGSHLAVDGGEVAGLL